MKKRIMFFHSSAGLYGSDKALYEIVKHLKSNYKVLVVLAEDGKLCKRINELKVEVFIEELSVLRRKELSFNPVSYVQTYFKLIKIVKDFRPDLIYANTSVIPLVGLVSKALKVKSICHVREIYSEWSWLWMFYQRYLTWTFDKLLVISRSVKDQFDSRKKIELCFDGTDLKGIRKIEKDINKENLVYGYVGRLSYKKGVDIVIKAFAKILKKHPNVKLKIFGAPYRTNKDYGMILRDLASDLRISDSVDFLGEIEDCSVIYRDLDVLVLGTRNIEPLGLVVMEGMVRAKVVIAPNEGGPAELIDDKLRGLLYVSGEVESLYKQMLKVLRDKDLRIIISTNAKKYAEENFSLEDSLKKLSRIISGVI